MKTSWFIESKEKTNAVIEDEMRLAFSLINRNSIGTYSCYSMPADVDTLGTSKLVIKITDYDELSVIIEYVSFDTDPTSKRLVFPHSNRNLNEKSNGQPFDEANTEDLQQSVMESEKIPRMEIIFEKPRSSVIRLGDTVEVVCNINDNHMNCK
jgi:hypothetical protein